MADGAGDFVGALDGCTVCTSDPPHRQHAAPIVFPLYSYSSFSKKIHQVESSPIDAQDLPLKTMSFPPVTHPRSSTQSEGDKLGLSLGENDNDGAVLGTILIDGEDDGSKEIDGTSLGTMLNEGTNDGAEETLG